jgi:DNA-binding MarR family transcriptional regulator
MADPTCCSPLAADLLDLAWFLRPHGQDDPCCGELSAAEFRALATVAGGDCRSQQEIGAALGVTRSGATRVVDRLEERGLARRCCSTVDRRRTCVELTARGRRALAGALGCFDTLIESLLAPLGRAERRQIATSLATLARLARRHRPERTPS